MSDPMTISFSDAISLFFERSNALQTYWNFYLTVILGLLAFFGTAKVTSKTKFVAALVTVAFAGFCVVNLGGLLSVTEQRLDVCSYLAHAICAGDAVQIVTPMRITLHPPSQCQVIALHLFGDVFSIAAIWFLALRKEHA
jgi:hypothetical protein